MITLVSSLLGLGPTLMHRTVTFSVRVIFDEIVAIHISLNQKPKYYSEIHVNCTAINHNFASLNFRKFCENRNSRLGASKFSFNPLIREQFLILCTIDKLTMSESVHIFGF